MTQQIAGLRRPPLLSPLELVRDGASRVRAAGAPFWIIWSVYATVAVAAQLGMRGAGASVVGPSAPAIAYQVFLALTSSLAEVLGLRILLRGREDWLRLNGRALYAGGLLMGAQLAIVAMGMLLPGAGTGNSSSAAVAFLGLGLYAASVYVIGKLALWPVGIVAGEAGLTPARAWRSMQRTLRSLVLAMAILAVPVVVITLFGVIVLRVGMKDQPATMVAALTLGGVMMSLVSQGVIVSIYERRVRRPNRLGEIFE